jgi:hypothetical protein
MRPWRIAMSQEENLEFVQRGYKAFAEGTYRRC